MKTRNEMAAELLIEIRSEKLKEKAVLIQKDTFENLKIAMKVLELEDECDTLLKAIAVVSK